MIRIRVYLVGVVVGVIAAVSAGAYAATTSGSAGRITVCVHRTSGLLYRAKACHVGDATLTWDVRGPAGRNGRNGHDGAPGAPGTDGTNGINGINGTNGTNGAVADYATQEVRGAGLASPLTNVLTENLPAGSFLVVAKLNYVFASNAPSTADGFASGSCTLSDGYATDTSNAFQHVQGTSAGQGSAEGEAPMSMQLALAESVSTTVSLSCTEPTGATTMALVYDADLDAIQATQITGTPSNS